MINLLFLLKSDMKTKQNADLLNQLFQLRFKIIYRTSPIFPIFLICAIQWIFYDKCIGGIKLIFSTVFKIAFIFSIFMFLIEYLSNILKNRMSFSYNYLQLSTITYNHLSTGVLPCAEQGAFPEVLGRFNWSGMQSLG